MKNQKMINLPFVETVSRSFMYTLCNWELFLKTVSPGLVVVVLEMFSGFPILCSLSNTACADPNSLMARLSALLVLLISVAVIINYCRAIILKAPVDFLSCVFVRRVLFYILATLLLALAIILPFILLAVFYGVILEMIGNNIEPGAVSYLVLGIALIALCVFLAPVFLVFAAITVDDRTMTVKEAFRLSRGNYNKIFWGQAVLMIPGAVAVFLLSLIYQAMAVESYAVKFIFMVMVLGLSFLDSCFKASFFAHIYQYFTFYKDKELDSEKDA